MPRLRLTASFVRTAICSPSYTKVDYFDTDQAGFLLEVRMSGGRTYYQRYTDERGRKRQYRLGNAEVLTLRTAKKLGKSAVAQAILGADPTARRQALRSIPSVHDFLLNSYLPHVASYKRSWKTDETIIRIHILPRIGRRAVDEVNDRSIMSIVNDMKSAGYSNGTRNRVIIVLRHAYNLARRWKILSVVFNPTDGIPLAPDVCRQRFLNNAETAALLKSLLADENQVAAQAIRLLLLTGARRNEITHAKWEQVDFEQHTLSVPLSKSGRSRVIALSSESIKVLREVVPVPGNPYIFPSPVTGRPSKSLHFPWVRIKQRAGLKDLRLHDLRHTFASLLVNDGASLYVVQELLGHSAPRYTQRYSHLSSRTLSAAVEQVAKMVTRSL